MQIYRVVLTIFCLSFTYVNSSWLNYVNLPGQEPNADTLPAVAQREGENKLVQYVKQAKLDGVLSGKGPFTLFGPTDVAFGRLPDYLIHYLKKNITALTDVLKYHVIAGETVFSSQLKDNQLVESYLKGAQIRINKYRNGVITASGRPIVKTDVNASNGVLHETGRVLLPPVGDIIQTMTDKGMDKTFGTLVKAVTAAGLVEALKGTGPLTVFAPTNQAFAKVDPQVLADLLKDKKRLTSVLLYHVVAGAAYSPGLTDGDIVTLNGSALHFKVNQEAEEVFVNGAKVEYEDLSTTNGVIQVIDKVLGLPEVQSPPPEVRPPPRFDVIGNRLGYDPLYKILRMN